MRRASLLHVVVMAGGSGTRFWPLSRRLRPKQLLDLTGRGSLLGATFERVAATVPHDRWWMVVGATHAEGCIEAAPAVDRSRVLVEPVGRNTAPAIALAALHLRRHDPDGVMAVLPADHHVDDADAFCGALSRAAELAGHVPIVTLGIRPTRPETGYGYIQRGEADDRVSGAFRVQKFCEKPNLEQARQFLASGDFDWNAGIFVMRPSAYLDEVQRQLPELSAAMQRVADVVESGSPASYDAVLGEVYGAIEGISIDYGIMEHAPEVAVVPVQCGWSDVGSWSALDAVTPADDDGNVVQGRAVAIDSKGCVIHASEGHAVAVIGLDRVVVVHTEDATLVVPVERAQEVRDVRDTLKQRGWTDLV